MVELWLFFSFLLLRPPRTSEALKKGSNFEFLTYNLLTIASFRIGVPSILFFPASEAPKNFWGPQKRFKFWILDLKVCLKKLDIGSGWYGKSVAYLFYYYWPHHFFTFRFVRTGDGSDKSPSNAQCFIFCLCSTRQLIMIIFFQTYFTTNTN